MGEVVGEIGEKLKEIKTYKVSVIEMVTSSKVQHWMYSQKYYNNYV